MTVFVHRNFWFTYDLLFYRKLATQRGIYKSVIVNLPVVRYKNPQPNISVFREASFGHGQLRVVNASHAEWTWHRNDDAQPDSTWITSLASDPACVV